MVEIAAATLIAAVGSTEALEAEGCTAVVVAAAEAAAEAAAALT